MPRPQSARRFSPPQPLATQTARVACVFLFAASLLGCASTPRTVRRVELDRYVGKWYEIAKDPQPYEEGCVASTSTYAPLAGGKIWVVSECRQGSVGGPIHRVEGMAYVADPDTNAKWRIDYPHAPTGDYWILDLDADYRYAIVGTPDRKGLWILSRTPTVPPDVYEHLLARAKDKGFDTDRLRMTPQVTA